MRWVELSLEVEKDAAEIVAGILHFHAGYGYAIQRIGTRSRRRLVRAYWLDNSLTGRIKPLIEEDLDRLRQTYRLSGALYKVVDDDIWWNIWKIDLYAVRAGRHIFICPPHAVKEADPDEIVIVMDPGVAFGSGSHSSTNTMLAALEDARDNIQGAQTLDLGCGSGILSIAALKMGVAHVLAVDIDPNAMRSTAHNAVANGLADRIDTKQGSLDIALQSAASFDLVMANILGHVIIGMCEQGLANVVRPGGIGLFAGIRDDQFGQVGDVDAALRRVGLIPYRQRLVAHWAVIETRREI